MIFAYLLSAYDQPDQLMLLIDKLLEGDPRDFVVLHLDAKGKLPPDVVTTLRQKHGDRILNVEPPLVVHWGHYNQVSATVRQIELAMTRSFDMAHLVSGSDWPVVPRAQIVADIAHHDEMPCYIEMLSTEQEHRMQLFWFHERYFYPRAVQTGTYRFKRDWLHRFSRLTNALMSNLGIERSRPFDMPWRKGWHWWSLPVDVCRTVVTDVIAIERSGRMRFTCVPIEHVIQTSVFMHYADRIETDRRFTDWTGQTSSPVILTTQHLPVIAASDAWFGRKFDMQADDFFIDAYADFAAPVNSGGGFNHPN